MRIQDPHWWRCYNWAPPVLTNRNAQDIRTKHHIHLESWLYIIRVWLCWWRHSHAILGQSPKGSAFPWVNQPFQDNVRIRAEVFLDLYWQWTFWLWGSLTRCTLNIRARAHTHTHTHTHTHPSPPSHSPPLCWPLVPSSASTLQSSALKSNLLAYLPEEKVGSGTQ